MEIKIDVTDWQEEHDKAELQILTEENLLELSTKMHPAKIARLYIISREKKLAPDDLLPANKPLFQVGAAAALSSVIARQRKSTILPNGKEFEVREYVGVVKEEDETSFETFVKVESEEGVKRALDYLLNTVPGYVMGRLKIIAASGGDVEEAAEQLKDKIDEMVKILS
jgi:hypothetical protein